MSILVHVLVLCAVAKSAKSLYGSASSHLQLYSTSTLFQYYFDSLGALKKGTCDVVSRALVEMLTRDSGGLIKRFKSDLKMGPKAHAIKISGYATQESSWMDRVCQKIETYCDLGEPGRGPSLIIREIEVQINTLGAGLRNFAEEVNDFVQDLLNAPIIPCEVTGEKIVDLPKQRDMIALHGEQHIVKQSAKQAAAVAPMNFLGETCTNMSKEGGLQNDPDRVFSSGRLLRVRYVEEGEKFPFDEVAWDWPQQPYNQSFKARTLTQQPYNQSFGYQTQLQQPYNRLVEHLQQRIELGQASRSSLDIADSLTEGFIQDLTGADSVEDLKTSNKMVEGEDHSPATWSLLGDAKDTEIQSRDTESPSCLLDGWEGDDAIDEDDELEDWEIV